MQSNIELDQITVEGQRIMQICNSCRYCEGLCPVFGEMSQQKMFDNSSLNYLANLCHNCKGCYYGCQYAEPHEFQVNVPKTFADIRMQSYSQYAYPQWLSRLFNANALLTALSLFIGISLLFIGVAWHLGADNFFQSITESGSFFKVIPLWLMSGVPTVISVFIVWSLFCGLRSYLQDIDVLLKDLTNTKVWLLTITDVLSLKHQSGGDAGLGCTHVSDERSHSRRIFHQLVMYGFLLCFASTCVASFYHYVLGEIAPYDWFSVPVILGTVGGIGLIIGCAGLFILKLIMDKRTVSSAMMSMEYTFLLLLFIVSLSGIALLIYRETIWMPTLLCVHLGAVFSFFITLPFSKFVHALYRFGAVLAYRAKQVVNIE